MSNFTHLELHHPEKLLGVNPELAPAIPGPALPLLQSIIVMHAGPLCGAMLEKLRTPLVYAYVDIDWESDIESNPAILLRHARDTLQELDAYWTDSLTRDAPKFRKLSKLSFNYVPVPSSRDWLEMQEICDDHTHQHSWSSLHVFSGSVNVLYMLHLRCPILRLNVHDEEDMLPALALQEILLDTKPTHLILETERTGVSYYFDPDFMLELVIKFWPFYDEGVVVEELLGNVLKILRATHVCVFRLVLDVSNLELTESSISDESSDAVDAIIPTEDIVLNDGDDDNDYDDAFVEGTDMVPIEYELKDLDLQGVIELILGHQPPLGTAIVTISGHTTRGFVTHQKGPDIVYDADIPALLQGVDE
ncbi:hypothetical protein C8T65DRAFT_697446 [Cerioporus squamosus]|nr:hypothetical protein C8T65DRAFT_697446 [Cerioporus squamosus]